MTPPSQALREAVACFSTPADLQGAIDELLSSGFDRAELSLLASEQAVEEKLRHAYRRVEDLGDDPDVPRVCYVSAEAIGDAQGGLIAAPLYVAATAAAGAILASGGTMATAIIGAAIAGGTGGLIGSVLAGLVGRRHAEALQEQLEHGGLLLWVRTWDDEDERRALRILARHRGKDVHVHTLLAE